MKSIRTIAVLGAGSWGAVMACHLFKKGYDLRLWDKPEVVSRLRATRRCQKLKEVIIPRKIKLCLSLEEALAGADLIVMAIPSEAMRQVCRQISSFSKGVYFVSLVKGIENGSLRRMSEIIEQEIKGAKVAVISGPSHAEEVYQGLPAAVVASGNDLSLISLVQRLFSRERFRIYANTDLVGVEVAGALKNIMAIACGVSDGLGLGDNTKAALMTRGLAELTRLGVAMGGRLSTFAGLAGIGDLIATCTSSHSRNRNLGEALASGKSLKQALDDLGMVAEGVPTAKSAMALGKRFGIELPITKEVYAILFKGKSPSQAVKNLLSRVATTEWPERITKKKG
jgi:glycerol-3-phosphate dehydrogenase (NAD(P)+)